MQSTQLPDINQSHLHIKFNEFLAPLGEVLPDWSTTGLCSAYTLLLMRSDILGQDAKYLQRLRFLSFADSKTIKKMGELLKEFKSRYAELVEENKLLLEEELKKYPNDKVKQENARKLHYENTENQVLARLNKKNKDLLSYARELHVFINSLLFAFSPGVHIQLRSPERPVGQEDIIDILKIIPPDAFIQSPSEAKHGLETKQQDAKEKPGSKQATIHIPIRQAYKFHFNFTKAELSYALEKTIRDDDLLRIVSSDHVMYISKKNNKYILYDPNIKTGPIEFNTPDSLAHQITKCFYTSDEKTNFMPIGFDIYEKNIGPFIPRQPTPSELMNNLFEKRGGKNSDIDAQGHDGATALYVAARYGNKTVVDDLLSRRANPNLVTELMPTGGTQKDLYTAIHTAAYSGYADIVDSLLQNRADMRVTTKRGGTPIHSAAQANNLNVINVFIKHKVNLDQRTDDGETALFTAASCGFSPIVQTLLDHKADPNAARKSDGFTPLMNAVMNGHHATISLLLEKKAEISTTANDGTTALHLAIKIGHADAAEILLSEGAKLDEKDKNKLLYIAAASGKVEFVKKIIKQHDPDLNSEITGNLPLHVAIEKGHTTTAEILLKERANPLLVNTDGDSPLMLATRKGLQPIVRLLIEKKADPNPVYKSKDTPLHTAAANDRLTTLSYLLECKAKINSQTKNGDTPLHLACKNRKLSTIKLLMNAKAALDIANAHGVTPLMLSVEKGLTSTTDFLLKCETNKQATRADGYNLLHIAAEKGRNSLIEKLIKNYQLDINSKNLQGETPLHIAIKTGQLATAKILMDLGAKTNIEDKNGMTPFMVAIENGFDEIATVLYIEKKSDAGHARQTDGYNSLHIAVEKGDTELVQKLLDYKIHINTPALDLRTALHIAIQNGDIANAVYLLQKKANPNLADKNKNTPLLLAVEKGNETLVKELLEQKADVSPTNKFDSHTAFHKAVWNRNESLVKLFIECKINPNLPDRNSNTPLTIALQFSTPSIVEMLLKAGADPTIVETHSRSTPLMLAIQRKFDGIYNDFLERGMDIHTLLPIDGKNALFFAVEHKQVTLVATLLSKGADHTIQDTLEKNTALHRAFELNELKIAELLIKSGARMDIKNAAGMTPLMLATIKGLNGIVRSALDSKLDVGVTTEKSETLLHIAAANGHELIYDLLIEKKLDVDAKSQLSNTPLHMAIQNDHASIALKLLGHKANPNIPNENGITPLIIAVKINNAKIIEALLDAKANVDIQDSNGLTPLQHTYNQEIIKLLKKAGAKVPEDVPQLPFQSQFVDDSDLPPDLPDLADIDSLANESKTKSTTEPSNNSTILPEVKVLDIPAEFKPSPDQLHWLQKQVEKLMIICEEKRTFYPKARELYNDVVKILDEKNNSPDGMKFSLVIQKIKDMLDSGIELVKKASQKSSFTPHDFFSNDSKDPNPYQSTFYSALYQLLKSVETNISSANLNLPQDAFKTVDRFPDPMPKHPLKKGLSR